MDLGGLLSMMWIVELNQSLIDGDRFRESNAAAATIRPEITRISR